MLCKCNFFWIQLGTLTLSSMKHKCQHSPPRRWKKWEVFCEPRDDKPREGYSISWWKAERGFVEVGDISDQTNRTWQQQFGMFERCNDVKTYERLKNYSTLQFQGPLIWLKTQLGSERICLKDMIPSWASKNCVMIPQYMHKYKPRNKYKTGKKATS